MLVTRNAFFDHAIQASGPQCRTQTWSDRVTAPREANHPGAIGQEVRDGKLAFTATSFDVCKDGQIKLHMTVKNTSDSAKKLLAYNQLLLRHPDHASGEVPRGGFACDRCNGKGADIYINAGDSTDAVVSFDIGGEAPAIEAFELHDSMFSDGVKVYP